MKKLLYILIISLFVFACSNQKQTTEGVVNSQGIKNQEEYKLFIENGDGFLKSKKYAEAKEQYQNALKIQPNEMYPISQIEKIEYLLNLDKKEEILIEFDEQEFKLFEDSINKLKITDYKFDSETKLFPEETYGEYIVLYTSYTAYGSNLPDNDKVKRINKCCTIINSDFKPKEFGEGPYGLTMYGNDIIVYHTKPSKSESMSFYLKRK